ncbi:histidine phosphatase family protein, partial [Actinoplanes campanulatus]
MTITDLYLVRHGLANGDGELSPLGREQADRAGRRLSTVTFDAIHHSALPRAAATAQIIAGHVPAPRHACDHMLDRRDCTNNGVTPDQGDTDDRD